MSSKGVSAPKEWTTTELGAFFVQNRAEFLAHAKRVTRTLAEAEEIVQDSLVRVLLACPDLENAQHAQAYFHRVIENLSVDLHRREGRQPHLVLLDELSGEVEARWQDQSDLSEIVSAADDAAIIREAIALLSHAERAALVMWEFEGRSTAEIAQELGVNASVVRQTLSRARARLRRILSERVIDESRGTTALDLLSVTYRKSQAVVKKSSRVALSLFLLIGAFLGLQSLASSDYSFTNPRASLQDDQAREELGKSSSSGVEISENNQEASSANKVGELSSSATKSAVKSLSLDLEIPLYAGLDSEGVPTSFTISDSRGLNGVLFSGSQTSFLTETGLLISNIVSTKSGASNVLIDQSVVVDGFGTSYVAKASAGINGGWQPLVLSYVSSDVQRLASGNYLLTAVMMVDSSLDAAVRVSTGSFGVDLAAAPTSLSTRLLLDPSKTKILAQAVWVSADSQEDGA
jgi:RNA polymerase sigma factor (sigma-70 family)